MTDASVQLALRGRREGRERGLLQQAVAERALELGEAPDLADDLGTKELAMSPSALPATAAATETGNSRPTTEATCASRRAPGSSRSMRATSSASSAGGSSAAVFGVIVHVRRRSPPVSSSARSSSSRYSGLPSALATTSSFTGSPTRPAGTSSSISARAASASSGASDSSSTRCANRVCASRRKAHPCEPGSGRKRRREHHRRAVGEREQPFGQLAGGPIGPVEVVDRQHQRSRRAERLRPQHERVLHPIRQLVGREREQLAFDVLLQADREHQTQVRERSVLRRPEERAGPRPKLGPDRELRVRLLDPQPGPQELDEGTVRRARPVGDAPPLEPGDVLARERQELGEHPRLAQPGVADHEHHLPAARRAGRRPPSRAGASSPSRPTRGVRDGGSVTGRGPTSREADDGFGPALHRHLAERLEHEPFVQARRGPRADRDRPGLGGALEPRGDVRRVAERDGLRVLPAYEPDRGRPAVQAHADVEALDPPRRLDLARVAGGDADDPQRRPCRAFGIVLVGGGNAEVRADPVAHERLDHAAEVLDGAAHPRDALADERLDLVGPEPFAQAGRPDDVGEQRRDRPHLVLPSRFVAHRDPLRAAA